MERYPITEKDRELIEIGLDVLEKNFDDGVYNHTVGCTILCKNGNIYKGVNCDGIHGSCAEYITIGIADRCCMNIVPTSRLLSMMKTASLSR